MSETPHFPNVVLWAIPFFVIAMVLEGVVSGRNPAARGYARKDTLTSLCMGIGRVSVDLAFGFLAAGLLSQAYAHRLFTQGTGLASILACFLLDDLRYYWMHRIAHRCRWVWAFHVVHHSSEHYNLSTALRQPWTGPFTGMVFLSLPLALLGFHPSLIVFCGGLSLIYQFWIHTETIDRMPAWFELILNTPSHHRVHHGINTVYLDSNYAGTFMVWDRLFGTFVPENSDEPVCYGLLKQLETFNPVKVAFHEYVAILQDITRRDISWWDRFRYVFGVPGWSHDESRHTVDQLKQSLLRLEADAKPAPPEVKRDAVSERKAGRLVLR